MKKNLLTPFLVLSFLMGHSAYAQDRDNSSDNKDTYLEGHYKGDYHCYRAWRKDMKIKRKLWQAEELEHFNNPLAADRKMRAAYRKAWRRDMVEHEHRTGYYNHDGEGWSRRRDYWY